MQRRLGRGVNVSALDAPNEGAWGQSLSADVFDKAKEGGFATVRLPVRWSNHALGVAPFAIDEWFFKRVDYAIDMALARGLNIVIDMHHHRQLCGEALDLGEHAVAAAVLDERFVAMWRQIAQRYRGRPSDRVVFELYNEPNTTCTAARWNDLLWRALAAVRESNPDRNVVVGAAGWNSAEALPALALPDDAHLIVTIHNYSPLNFTHQGASWTGDPAAYSWIGTVCCDAVQRAQIAAEFDRAVAWAGTRWPLWLGEFGSNDPTPYVSRVDHARTVRQEAENRGITWAVWQLAGNFGFYDTSTRQWKTELRDALTGP
jgi:endoglucanase